MTAPALVALAHGSRNPRSAETISALVGEVLSAEGVAPDDVAIVWSDTQGSELATIETGDALWTAGVPLFSEFWVDGLDAHGGIDAAVGGRQERLAVEARLDSIHHGLGRHRVIEPAVRLTGCFPEAHGFVLPPPPLLVLLSTELSVVATFNWMPSLPQAARPTSTSTCCKWRRWESNRCISWSAAN